MDTLLGEHVYGRIDNEDLHAIWVMSGGMDGVYCPELDGAWVGKFNMETQGWLKSY